MSRQYEFPIPNEKTRKLILNIFLKNENTCSDIDLSLISKKTKNYTGSDLQELCKYAATLPLREFVRINCNNLNKFYSFENTTSTKKGDEDTKTKNISSNNSFISQLNPFLKTKNTLQNTKNNNSNTMLNNLTESIKKKNKKINLRSINMNDFIQSLKMIKSTSMQHKKHEMKYGYLDNNNNSKSTNNLPFNNFFNYPKNNLNNNNNKKFKGPKNIIGKDDNQDINQNNDDDNSDDNIDIPLD